MQNRSNTGGRENPLRLKGSQARAFSWDPIQRIALGPAATVPRKQAEHIAAPGHICTYVE